MNRTILRVPLAALASGLLLFLWGGASMALPWGVPSAQVLFSAAGAPATFQGPEVRSFPAHHFTTPAFDAEMAGRVSTLTTDATFSWIVSSPTSRYAPAAYLGRELAIQLCVGALLTLLVLQTRDLRPGRRLLLALTLALLASAMTYGRLMNWWGLPAAYALGESLNLTIGWLAATALAAKLALTRRAPS